MFFFYVEQFNNNNCIMFMVQMFLPAGSICHKHTLDVIMVKMCVLICGSYL